MPYENRSGVNRNAIQIDQNGRRIDANGYRIDANGQRISDTNNNVNSRRHNYDGTPKVSYRGNGGSTNSNMNCRVQNNYVTCNSN